MVTSVCSGSIGGGGVNDNDLTRGTGLTGKSAKEFTHLRPGVQCRDDEGVVHEMRSNEEKQPGIANEVSIHSSPFVLCPNVVVNR